MARRMGKAAGGLRSLWRLSQNPVRAANLEASVQLGISTRARAVAAADKLEHESACCSELAATNKPVLFLICLLKVQLFTADHAMKHMEKHGDSMFNGKLSGKLDGAALTSLRLSLRSTARRACATQGTPIRRKGGG